MTLVNEIFERMTQTQHGLTIAEMAAKQYREKFPDYLTHKNYLEAEELLKKSKERFTQTLKEVANFFEESMPDQEPHESKQEELGEQQEREGDEV